MAKVKTSPEACIYVVAGDDEALVAADGKKVVDSLLKEDEKSMGLSMRDGDESSAAEVLDELRTLSFFGGKRVVYVKNADKFISNNRELLEKYFENPCSSGILIMQVGKWDSRTKLAKKLPDVGKLISFTQPKRGELSGYLVRYAAEAHDKKLMPDVAGLIIELMGENLSQLYGEIDKLALFADREKNITVKQVEKLTGHNRTFDAFEVIDAITAGNIGGAVERLRRMFAEDKSAEYSATGAFAYHFRKLFRAKALLQKGQSTWEIGKKVGVWGNVDGFYRQVRKMTLEQIGGGLAKLAEIDYAIKTGRTTAQSAIERFVLTFASDK